jgi:SAM-dependent methyltransferase
MTGPLADRHQGWRPLGAALLDYHRGDEDAEITVSSEIWEDETTPVAHYYRPPGDDLPERERRSLEMCRGRVLDLGAGAGRHALELQRAGHPVVAIDVLPEAVQIMRERGVTDARCGDLDDLDGETFDTVLMLMHGIGVVGDLRGLGRLLQDLPRFLNPGGRLICDSADLAVVLGEEAPGLLTELNGPSDYVGEVEFVLRYGDLVGSPYPWLFVDPDALGLIAGAAGFDCRVEIRGDRGSFVASLQPMSTRRFTRV